MDVVVGGRAHVTQFLARAGVVVPTGQMELTPDIILYTWSTMIKPMPSYKGTMNYTNRMLRQSMLFGNCVHVLFYSRFRMSPEEEATMCGNLTGEHLDQDGTMLSGVNLMLLCLEDNPALFSNDCNIVQYQHNTSFNRRMYFESLKVLAMYRAREIRALVQAAKPDRVLTGNAIMYLCQSVKLRTQPMEWLTCSGVLTMQKVDDLSVRRMSRVAGFTGDPAEFMLLYDKTEIQHHMLMVAYELEPNVTKGLFVVPGYLCTDPVLTRQETMTSLYQQMACMHGGNPFLANGLNSC